MGFDVNLESLLSIAQTTTPTTVVPDNDVMSSIRRFKQKQVLVLGKDTGSEYQYLVNICKSLQSQGYSPLLVKDHRDLPELSNEEKVRVLADMSRFVILENTFPAGQIAECKICSTNRIICAALRQRGKGSSFMVTDYFKDFDFMAEFEYEDTPESLSEAVRAAIKWAEQKTAERIEYYNSRYPWRKDDLSGSK